jgi:acyl-CoA synthetase (AMP-forming)/AMP-acid ligase II
MPDPKARGGRNIYPHEVEGAVSEIPGVRKGCVVVFGSPDAASGTERVVVLAETRERGQRERQQLCEAINTAVVKVLGEPADQVVLVPPREHCASRDWLVSTGVPGGGRSLVSPRVQ